MAQESGRTGFHYGFYAAMKVEYAMLHADLTYEQEIQLGEDPIRLDFLIIKKDAKVALTDPIGKFFKFVNIFEYKSPEDGLSIDDFYKAVGYALIYKGYDRKVDELPMRDMTLTIVRHAYPRELIKALERDGFVVKKEYPGIFRIDGKVCLDVQLIVSSRLPDEEYEGLQLLAKGCTKDELFDYAVKTMASDDENVKINAGTVIGICLKVNNNLSGLLKEDSTMTTMTGAEFMALVEKKYKEAVNALVQRDLHKAIQKGIQEGMQKGVQLGRQEGVQLGKQEGIQEGRQEGVHEEKERVASDMLKKNLPLSLIVEISKLSKDSVLNLAKSLGITVM